MAPWTIPLLLQRVVPALSHTSALTECVPAGTLVMFLVLEVCSPPDGTLSRKNRYPRIPLASLAPLTVAGWVGPDTTQATDSIVGSVTSVVWVNLPPRSWPMPFPPAQSYRVLAV